MRTNNPSSGDYEQNPKKRGNKLPFSDMNINDNDDQKIVLNQKLKYSYNRNNYISTHNDITDVHIIADNDQQIIRSKYRNNQISSTSSNEDDLKRRTLQQQMEQVKFIKSRQKSKKSDDYNNGEDDNSFTHKNEIISISNHSDTGYDTNRDSNQQKDENSSSLGRHSDDAVVITSSSSNEYEQILNLVKNIPSPTDITTPYYTSEFTNRNQQQQSIANQQQRKQVRTRIQPLPDTSESTDSISQHQKQTLSYRKNVQQHSSSDIGDNLFEKIPPNGLEYILDERYKQQQQLATTIFLNDDGKEDDNKETKTVRKDNIQLENDENLSTNHSNIITIKIDNKPNVRLPDGRFETHLPKLTIKDNQMQMSCVERIIHIFKFSRHFTTILFLSLVALTIVVISVILIV
ncbi:unnamed protein product [Didymodactylos carnosus]|uniref:Uncharacterized protein n=1 Tax=Didymodactylos carnosus TaxID=1234261 RepID=A0A814JTT4_9BILA|nr:unnamed protein product [Didymodactylos carnosus]CAF1042082.1 unnamed protein product [Didymodactylos carnosus]CAF3650055.1 unnamed protein product [Didymodactylos carnosus]CAF3812282.1 unnamed protein product [Didymodactylos carnosus]